MGWTVFALSQKTGEYLMDSPGVWFLLVETVKYGVAPARRRHQQRKFEIREETCHF